MIKRLSTLTLVFTLALTAHADFSTFGEANKEAAQNNKILSQIFNKKLGGRVAFFTYLPKDLKNFLESSDSSETTAEKFAAVRKKKHERVRKYFKDYLTYVIKRDESALERLQKTEQSTFQTLGTDKDILEIYSKVFDMQLFKVNDFTLGTENISLFAPNVMMGTIKSEDLEKSIQNKDISKLPVAMAGIGFDAPYRLSASADQFSLNLFGLKELLDLRKAQRTEQLKKWHKWYMTLETDFDDKPIKDSKAFADNRVAMYEKDDVLVYECAELGLSCVKGNPVSINVSTTPGKGNSTFTHNYTFRITWRELTQGISLIFKMLTDLSTKISDEQMGQILDSLSEWKSIVFKRFPDLKPLESTVDEMIEQLKKGGKTSKEVFDFFKDKVSPYVGDLKKEMLDQFKPDSFMGQLTDGLMGEIVPPTQLSYQITGSFVIRTFKIDDKEQAYITVSADIEGGDPTSNIDMIKIAGIKGLFVSPFPEFDKEKKKEDKK